MCGKPPAFRIASKKSWPLSERQSLSAHQAAEPLNLGIAIVCNFQPTFHVIIDIFQRSDFEAMSDAIFPGIAAGVDESLRSFQIAQRQSIVDACLGCRLDLSEDVFAIERDKR